MCCLHWQALLPLRVYHKEENTGLMNLILVLIAAVVGWLLPKNDHVLSMIAAVASFAALYLSAHAMRPCRAPS